MAEEDMDGNMDIDHDDGASAPVMSAVSTCPFPYTDCVLLNSSILAYRMLCVPSHFVKSSKPGSPTLTRRGNYTGRKCDRYVLPRPPILRLPQPGLLLRLPAFRLSQSSLLRPPALRLLQSGLLLRPPTLWLPQSSLLL